jgi:hypothetical protein
MKKFGITPEVTKQWMDAGMQAEKEIEQAGKDGRLQETEEYKKWKAENDAMKDKVQELLDEFYEGRKVTKNARIIIDRDATESWCIHNGGKDYYDVTRKQDDISNADKKHYQKILDGKNSKKEQGDIEKRVEKYRAEFQKFAVFMKEKYFKNNNEVEQSEVSPEFVEQVEKTKLNTESKVNLFLVEAGLKPSTGMDLTIRNGENVFLTEADLQEIKSVLEQSGLAFKEWPREANITGDGVEVEMMEIAISRTQKDLKNLEKIIKRLPTPKDVEEGKYSDEDRKKNYSDLGKAYGYPKTAVEAFVKDETINEEDLHDDVKKSDAYAFALFSLSKNNWQKELEQGKKWADCIKSISPKTYQEMLEARLRH